MPLDHVHHQIHPLSITLVYIFKIHLDLRSSGVLRSVIPQKSADLINIIVEA
jgi:hypothetical protein